MTAQDKATIRAGIVGLMCACPANIQRQVSEAVRLIADVDFPENWPTLLPGLIEKLNSQDLVVIVGVLETANSILKRFRYVQKSDALYVKLKYVLETFQEPLLKVLYDVRQHDKGILKSRPSKLEAAVFCPQTKHPHLFSLNWQDIPEYFEDHMKEWMAEFHHFLSYDNAALRDPHEEDEPDAIDELQTAIVENIKLYAEKYEEEFQPFLQQFTTDVWTLLVSKSTTQKYDRLVTTSIAFLSSITSKPMHRGLFQSPDTLKSICEKIVFPNITLRESDVELFEDNPVDYIRRDIEGSDSDTRRRSACDLVRSLTKNFEDETCKVCMAYIQHLLTSYQSNPASNWAMKDTAINMVIALSVRATVANKGASKVSDKIPFIQFAETYIYPAWETPARAIKITSCSHRLSSSSARFATSCPKTTLRSCSPSWQNVISSPNFVVHSYAAHTIERFFSMKTANSADLTPNLLQTLLGNIFSAMERPGYPSNEHLMKCCMRIVVVGNASIDGTRGRILNKLQTILHRTVQKSHQPRV